jgi:type I restriction enzyme R subunit
MTVGEVPAPNEADTCRRYVVPKLQAAGWENEPHRINEQVTFTDGRIVVSGQRGRRRVGKRADYILRCRPDLAIVVIEAKPTYVTPGEGLQKAKDYAEILGLKFAYATNGHGTGTAPDVAAAIRRGADSGFQG